MVVDITGKTASILSISNEEEFLLDSNILFWLYAGYQINPRDISKVSKYTTFIYSLINNGNNIWTSAGNIQEILNLIEKNEFEWYNTHNHLSLKKKDYRNIQSERTRIKRKSQAIYHAIESVCDIKRLVITPEQNKRFVESFERFKYDPIDFFIAENSVANCRLNVITDDRDFRIDNRLNIYTVL